MGYADAYQSTLDEHALVVDAILRQDVATAQGAMLTHIVGSWQRRRFGEPPQRAGG